MPHDLPLWAAVYQQAQLPRRWVVARSFARATRFRRLVKDCEGCARTPAAMHLVAFVCPMLGKAALLAAGP